MLKLRESPFYAESGGQISDTGWIHTDDGKANVLEVYSLGGDQVILAEIEEGRLEAGARAKGHDKPGAPPCDRLQPYGDPPAP